MNTQFCTIEHQELNKSKTSSFLSFHINSTPDKLEEGNVRVDFMLHCPKLVKTKLNGSTKLTEIGAKHNYIKAR